MKRFRLIVSLLVISFSLGVNISNHFNQQQINHIKTELKLKNKQIDELHKQVSRQTKRIAELTGNGG